MRSATVDGNSVKAARETLGLTQKELAERVGAKQSTISHLESNRPSGQPSGRLFRAICEALDVPRESLLVKKAA